MQLNVFCHYALRPDDLALVSMCLKPPSIALILSLAEPIAKKPSNDFLKRVYLASKRSASDCRQTVIDHLKQAPLPFQVDLVCEFSTWMNPCVGLVMIDWLLDQCLEERNRLLDHKQRATLNKQEKKQSLKIILSVMTSVYNGFSVFLHHSGHVKARHVERCMWCIPSLLDVLFATRPSLIKQLVDHETQLCFNPKFLHRYLWPALKAKDPKWASRKAFGQESLPSQYCMLHQQCYALHREANQGLLSDRDFSVKYRVLPRKMLQMLMFLIHDPLNIDGSIDQLMGPSMQPIINGLLALHNVKSSYKTRTSNKPSVGDLVSLSSPTFLERKNSFSI